MSSTVKDQFIDHMNLNGLAENTKRGYLKSVKRLAGHYNCSPDLLTKYQVELYFKHLILNKKLWKTRKVIVIILFLILT